jgi:hypothetical protein
MASDAAAGATGTTAAGAADGRATGDFESCVRAEPEMEQALTVIATPTRALAR